MTSYKLVVVTKTRNSTATTFYVRVFNSDHSFERNMKIFSRIYTINQELGFPLLSFQYLELYRFQYFRIEATQCVFSYQKLVIEIIHLEFHIFVTYSSILFMIFSLTCFWQKRIKPKNTALKHLDLVTSIQLSCLHFTKPLKQI